MVNALAVVAHHDDAILWTGGAIQRTRRELNWQWRIIAMCVPDPARQKYFRESCEVLNVQSDWCTFADYQGGVEFSRNNRDEMRASLIAAVQDQSFDWVFTHSRNPHGEYGRHANHVEVREIVSSLIQDGALGRGPSSIAYFSYEAAYGLGGLATVASPRATHYLQMTYPELQIKCEWSHRAPDADSNLASLAYPCPNPEAFEGDHLGLPSPFVHR